MQALAPTALAVVLAGSAAPAASAQPGPERPPFAETLCRGLGNAVDGQNAGAKAIFLASYRPGLEENVVPLPLRSSAFTYDNALAAIALTACGDVAKARRLGEGLLEVGARDRTFHDGRVRNAYRAGAVPADLPPLLPGWWDGAANRWAEDPYQNGTSTGNVAWASLALLTLHQATGDARYLAGARKLLDWIATAALDSAGVGFSGGLDGYDPAQTRLTWISTEHNVDVYAAATWFGRASRDGAFAGMAASARSFVAKAFSEKEGCFVMGTTPEGKLANTQHLALDTQLWPLLAVSDNPASWRRAVSCAEQRLGVEGGFDFDSDRDGFWTEGTAQAALTYRVLGRSTAFADIMARLPEHMSSSGWLFATQIARLSTGLKIGPASTEPDFFYYRRPHLGATAWAALAAIGWNPFTGKAVE